MSDKRGVWIDVRTTQFLTWDQLWPDGDEPEKPSVVDAAKVVEEDLRKYGGPAGWLREWALDRDLDIEIDGNPISSFTPKGPAASSDSAREGKG